MSAVSLPAARSSLSRQISRLVLAFSVITLALIGGLAWWAASRIDARSLERQLTYVTTGLQELAHRIPVEQDASAQWDEAVLNLRTPNDAWLAENLGEWVSEYFGHDLVYILDPADKPVRAIENGVRVANHTYGLNAAAIDGLVKQLRAEMAAASAGQVDSTAAVTGLGTLDFVSLANGKVGMVSVRPIIPGTELLTQAPGTEFLHISVVLIDEQVSAEIEQKYALEGLRFETAVGDSSGRALSPILNSSGRVLGFFTWIPYRPGFQLLSETGPVVAIVLVAAGLLVAMLFRRLRLTSNRLEVSEANAKYLAFHDALAGIPNRALFEDRLERAMTNARRSASRVAVHFIDLDRFKLVNDTLGHPAGDELIRQAAQRLMSIISDVDTVARVGGDEFAIIQVDVAEMEAALVLAQRIISELARPFDLAGHEALIGASVGVACSDSTDAAAMDMMRQADIALYEAKTSGRGRYELFAGELDLAVQERRTLELDLRNALQNDVGLELVYQPIYSTRLAHVTGAEALVRWNHPLRGRLPPATFVGLAEERGLIDALGMWVLRRACAFASTTQLPWVAVNVSPLQFRDERFADRVFAVLNSTGLEPRRLEIEITEGLLLQNSPRVQATLRQLRAGGVRVALDDFGTGYSSISYLRNHGVDKLKIDQSFVALLGKDLEIDDIVRCIIGLANAMHMKVTAEGVETVQQKVILESMGCDQLQGYLLSRPVTPEKLADDLAELLPQTVNEHAIQRTA